MKPPPARPGSEQGRTGQDLKAMMQDMTRSFLTEFGVIPNTNAHTAHSHSHNLLQWTRKPLKLQTTMTGIVPQDSSKWHVQSHEEAPHSKRARRGGRGENRENRNSHNEGVPLPSTISASRGTTMPVCGGVKAYNERSLRFKYCSQGVQTSFHKSTPSAQDPMGNMISSGDPENLGNVRANIPDASEERDNSGTS